MAGDAKLPLTPNVAHAVADAVIVALRAMLKDLAQLHWALTIFWNEKQGCVSRRARVLWMLSGARSQ